jgi:hypothetical protein
MSIADVISLFALCMPLVLSVSGAAVRICSKLEKISAALENMVSRTECLALRERCPALTGRGKRHQRSNAAASASPAAAALRRKSIALD